MNPDLFFRDREKGGESFALGHVTKKAPSSSSLGPSLSMLLLLLSLCSLFRRPPAASPSVHGSSGLGRRREAAVELLPFVLLLSKGKEKDLDVPYLSSH